MYNNTYEDYIRSILGYPNIQANNTQNIYDNTFKEIYSENTRNDVEQYYPEIYKIIYPMVKKACNENLRGNSEEEINRMTDEIYSAIEDNNQINININLENQTNVNRNPDEDINKVENRNNNKNIGKVTIPNNSAQNNRNIETRGYRNNNLRDLIKILLIRELLRRPNNRPPRPPYPGNPGPRPPIMPRNYNYEIPYYDIYEK